MMHKKKVAALCLTTCVAGGALAAVSPDEAARLGKDLTPMGAEMGGNADGSIPPWNPNGTPVPAGFKAPSDPFDYVTYPDPYAGEKPLYTIDGSNWQQYADNLTEGTKAIFEKLGDDGFKMHVYPSKRDFVVPDWVYANTAKNAVNAKLAADGQKVEGHYPGVPFPIPQSALEAIWNHMIRYGVDFNMDYDVYYVGANGKPVLSTTALSTSVFPMFTTPDEPVGDLEHSLPGGPGAQEDRHQLDAGQAAGPAGDQSLPRPQGRRDLVHSEAVSLVHVARTERTCRRVGGSIFLCESCGREP